MAICCCCSGKWFLNLPGKWGSFAFVNPKLQETPILRKDLIGPLDVKVSLLLTKTSWLSKQLKVWSISRGTLYFSVYRFKWGQIPVYILERRDICCIFVDPRYQPLHSQTQGIERKEVRWGPLINPIIAALTKPYGWVGFTRLPAGDLRNLLFQR